MSTPATRSGLAYVPEEQRNPGAGATVLPSPVIGANAQAAGNVSAVNQILSTDAGQTALDRQAAAADRARAEREAQIAAAAGAGGTSYGLPSASLPGAPGAAPGATGMTNTGGGPGSDLASLRGSNVSPSTPYMKHSRSAYINIAEPTNYYLGGDPQYVGRAAEASQNIANASAAQQAGVAGVQLGLAGASNVAGAQAADRMNNAGVTMANYGRGAASQINEQARATTAMGDQAFNQGAQAANRAGPVADFGQQNAALGQSQSAVDQLLAVEANQGPSAAQAQLQLGLNAAADSNTSLARSGRGWGQSASALAQAGRQNAVMGANVANQAAVLRAQEDAAARTRAASNIATGAGINQAAASQFGTQAQANVQNALQSTQLNDQARANLYNTGIQAQQVAGAQQTAAGQIGLEGLQSATNATAQGGQFQLAGQAQASQMAQAAAQNYATGAQQQQQGLTFGSQLAQTQLQASQAYEQARLQEYGIRKGVAIQNNNQTMQLIGAGLAAAGTAISSDIQAKDRIKPVSAVDSLLSGEEEDAAEDPFYGSSAGPSRADAMAADAGAIERGGQTRSPDYAGPDLDAMDSHMTAGAETEAEAKKSKGRKRIGGAMQAFGERLGGNGSAGLDFIEQYGRPRGFYQAPPITSDEREKTNLRPARGYSYEYKDPARHGRGRFVGPMAQDLLKTPAGKSSVVRQPDGTLGVDTGRLSLTNTSAIGEQQRRTDDVDERVSALERLLADDEEEQRGRRTAENSHRPKGRAA